MQPKVIVAMILFVAFTLAGPAFPTPLLAEHLANDNRLATGPQPAGTGEISMEFTTPLLPLEQLLNPDGTLDLSSRYTGTLDPRGWRLASISGQAPRFVRTGATSEMPGDERWQAGFVLDGPDGVVNAMAVDGVRGRIYVGGSFATAGGLAATNIARWDPADLASGGTWSTLGGGLSGDLGPWTVVSVLALTVDPQTGVLYAGGRFTTATNPDGGSVNATNIARWDPAANAGVGGWAALGGGVNGAVHSLALDPASGALYAGGGITGAVNPGGAGIPAANIVRWDPAAAGGSGAWATLGGGLNGIVHSLALDPASSLLYAGGGFGTATDPGGNPVAVTYIARWDASANDGAGAWANMGGGFDPGTTLMPLTLAVDSERGLLYAGGEVRVTSSCGDGCTITSMLDGVARRGLAGGGAWTMLGGAFDHDVAALALDAEGDPYVAGNFVSLAGPEDSTIITNRIARWDPAADGGGWTPVGGGADSPVSALALDPSVGRLYAGGYFLEVTNPDGSSVPTTRVASWDPAAAQGTGAWTALGASHTANAPVSALAVDGLRQRVYAGGSFTAAGGIAGARGIALWDYGDGTGVWTALGGGVDGTVNALALDGESGAVYVGGDFETATNPGGDGIPASRIARWDPQAGGGVGAWAALGGGLAAGSHGSVYALALDARSGLLYAGGYFSAATNPGGAEIAAASIAAWDPAGNGGTGAWAALGEGLGPSAYVNALALDPAGGALYVGGDFETATNPGGEVVAAANIARWNPTAAGGAGAWTALGGGLNGAAYALALDPARGLLYAGGDFTTAIDPGGNPVSANNIVLWEPGADGGAGSWAAMGGGVSNVTDEYVMSLTLDPRTGHLFAGGDFTTVVNSGGDPVAAANIARWDPEADAGSGAWQAVGSGVSGRVLSQALDPLSSLLWVGGDFSAAGGQISSYLARWSAPQAAYLPLLSR